MWPSADNVIPRYLTNCEGYEPFFYTKFDFELPVYFSFGVDKFQCLEHNNIPALLIIYNV